MRTPKSACRFPLATRLHTATGAQTQTLHTAHIHTQTHTHTHTRTIPAGMPDARRSLRQSRMQASHVDTELRQAAPGPHHRCRRRLSLSHSHCLYRSLSLAFSIASPFPSQPRLHPHQTTQTNTYTTHPLPTSIYPSRTSARRP